MRVVYGTAYYVNDHACMKRTKVTCAIMTNLIYALDVDMCMYEATT